MTKAEINAKKPARERDMLRRSAGVEPEKAYRLGVRSLVGSALHHRHAVVAPIGLPMNPPR